jgi:hypothetical protein
VSFGLLRLLVEANGETSSAGCRLKPPAAATSSRRLLAFVCLRQTHDRPFPTFIMLAAGVILMLPRMPTLPR